MVENVRSDMTDDPRPANCRFRLQDEGKPYPRSSCQACGASIMTGLGKSCNQMPSVMPVVSVKEMKTSAGSDYFVHIRVADREITPHVFKQRWQAEYEVDHWKWLLGQGDRPDIMDYGPERRQ